MFSLVSLSAPGYKTLRDHSFNVTNGSIENARRVTRGDSSHWEMEVAPDNDENIAIVLEANRSCTTTGAVCTSNNKQLSTRLQGVVIGPAGSQVTPQLTAEFDTIPRLHDGSNFTFRVRFSEAISISETNMRDHSFSLTDGSVESASKVSGSSSRWEIEVDPDSQDKDVVISLAANRSCDTQGAICTSDNRQLSASLEGTVSKIATSQAIDDAPVASISTEQTKGSMIDEVRFQVTLSKAATATTTVSVTLTQASTWFATSALSHSVSFAVGNTTKTITLSPRRNVNSSLTNGNLVATIQSGTGYTVSSSNASATVQMISTYPNLKYRITQEDYQVTEGNSVRITVEGRTEPGVPKPLYKDHVSPRINLTNRLFTSSDSSTAQPGTDFHAATFSTYNALPVNFHPEGDRYVVKWTYTVRTIENNYINSQKRLSFVIGNYTSSQSRFITVVDSDGSACESFTSDVDPNFACAAASTIYINDDEFIMASVEADRPTGSILDDNKFYVRLSQPAIVSTTVNLGITQASSWFASSDLPSSVTFAAGEREKVITLSENFPTTDGSTAHRNLASGNLVVSLQSGTGYTVYSSSASATTRIVSSHPSVKLRLTNSSYQINEGRSQVVTLEARTESGVPKPLRDISVKLKTKNDEALAGQDFISLDETVTFSSSNFSASGGRYIARKTVSLQTTMDQIDEEAETFELSLSDVQNPSPFIEIVNSSWALCYSGSYETCSSTATVTINDHDMKGVQISGTSFELENAGDTQSYSFALNTKPTGNVTITPSISNGGTGASITPASLTFTPSNWDTSQAFTFTKGSSSETTISHSITGGGYGDLTVPSVTMFAADDLNSPPRVNVQSSHSQVIEGSDTVDITVRLSRPAEEEITVLFRGAPSSTADFNEDYTFGGDESVVFATGEQEKTVRVYMIDDTFAEPDDLLVFELYNLNSSQVTAGVKTRHTITIKDDDKVTIGFERTNYSVREGNTTLSVSAIMDLDFQEVVISPFNITLATVEDPNSTATLGEDYQAIRQSRTLNFGISRATWNVQIHGDDLQEGNETFKLALEIPEEFVESGLVSLNPNRSTATVTIIDDEEPLKDILIQVSPTQAVEGETLEFSVSLNKASSSTVTVNYTTAIESGDTAEAADFTAVSDTLTFNPGDVLKKVSVETSMDMDALDETFSLKLSNAINADISTAKATGTIQDWGTLPHPVQVSLDSGSYTEGNTIPLTITINTPNDSAISHQGFSIRVRSSRSYRIGEQTFTMPANTRTKSFSLITKNDRTDDINEAVNLYYSSSDRIRIQPASGASQITLADNDNTPTFEFEKNHYEVREDKGKVEAKIVLNHPSDQVLRVSYRTQNGTASAPKDFLILDERERTFVFAPGETEKTLTFPIVNDSAMEPEVEGFTIFLYGESPNVTYSSFGSTVNIEDEDEVTISLFVHRNGVDFEEGAVLEESDTGEFRVEARVVKGGPIETSFQIRLTFRSGEEGGATQNADFAGESTRFSFGYHDTKQSLVVNLLEDQIDEPDERLVFVLEESESGLNPRVTLDDTTHTIIIKDNDTAGVTFTPSSLLAVAGKTVTFTMVLNSEPTDDVSAVFSLNDSSTHSITPKNLTFTPDNWNIPQTASLTLGNNLPSSLYIQVFSDGDENYGNHPYRMLISPDDPNKPPGLFIFTFLAESTEGSAHPLEFKVQLSRPAEQITRVSYRTRAKEVEHVDKLEYNVSASATDNVDYPRQAGTLTFNVGDQLKIVEFHSVNDNIVEADRELFEVELYNGVVAHT